MSAGGRRSKSHISESYLIKKVMERNEMATLGKIIRALSEYALAFRLACGSCGLWPHTLVVLFGQLVRAAPVPGWLPLPPLVRPGAQHLVV